MDLKTEEGAMSQEMWEACRTGKHKDTDSSLEGPEEIQPCGHLDLGP